MSHEPTRVAVIEDDPMMGESLIQRLKLEGYAPVLVANRRRCLGGSEAAAP